MAISNGYATLSELKAFLGISASTDDARLESAIESASRAIDAECTRQFYATTATLYFQTDDPLRLDLNADLHAVTSIAVDASGTRAYTALSASDYELDPEATPYRTVWIAPGTSAAFPLGRRGIRIQGAWGYCATGSYPQAINKACLILATRYFKRKDAPFGIVGTPELGYLRVTARDPEVRALLNPYRRHEVAGV